MRRGSSAARLLGIAGTNPSGGMDVCLVWALCYQISLCDGPITRPEESCWLCCVIECDIETWLRAVCTTDCFKVGLIGVQQSFWPSWFWCCPLICQYLLLNIFILAFLFAICGDFEKNGIHFGGRLLTPVWCSYRMDGSAIQDNTKNCVFREVWGSYSGGCRM